jgi:ubiquitin C-terminal hydrolase
MKLWSVCPVIHKKIPFHAVGGVYLESDETLMKVDLGLCWIMDYESTLYVRTRISHVVNDFRSQDNFVPLHFTNIELCVCNSDIPCQFDKIRYPLPGELFLYLDVVIRNATTGREILHRSFSNGLYICDTDDDETVLPSPWNSIEPPVSCTKVLVQHSDEIMGAPAIYYSNAKRAKKAHQQQHTITLHSVKQHIADVHWRKGGIVNIFFESPTAKDMIDNDTISLSGGWAEKGSHEWLRSDWLVFKIYPAFEIIRKYQWDRLLTDDMEGQIRSYISKEFMHGVKMTLGFNTTTMMLNGNFCMGCAVCQESKNYAALCHLLTKDIMLTMGGCEAITPPPPPPRVVVLDATAALAPPRVTNSVVSEPLSKSVVVVNRSGLLNLGNTCFLNSVLQVFIHCRYFTRLIGLDDEIIDPRGDHRLFILFRQLANDALAAVPKHVIDPRYFVGLIRAYCPTTFGNGGQHDAHEFLTYLLSEHFPFHERVNRRGMFSVGQSSRLTCPQCSKVSDTIEPCTNTSLSLALVGQTLEELIAQHCKVETLSPDDKWRCENCKNVVQASKQMVLSILGPVVIVQLKRFSSNGRKRNDNITFPLRGLKFRQNGDLYDLASVIYHQGALKSGHYTAACQMTDNSWMLFNDSRTTTIQSPPTTGAYVLIYQRRVFEWSSEYHHLMPDGVRSVVRTMLMVMKHLEHKLPDGIWKKIFAYL